MSNLDELANFLQNAHWPQIPERRPTFFSIAGFPHYENVMSNVYQFFFGTENSHGLGNLCIEALGDVIRAKHSEMPWPAHTFQRTHAYRELRTDNEKRLDILLHNGPNEDEWENASSVLLIENKVYHWLANDLGEYWQFVGSKNPSCQKIGIVLGLKLENIPLAWKNNWIAITHLEWAQAVEARLGPLIYRAESRYVVLLFELIENIRTMTKAEENFGESLKFFQDNRIAISRAEGIRNDLFSRVPGVVSEALSQKYSIEQGQKGHGWLTIHIPSSNKLKYILGYYDVFYHDEVPPNPNYKITLMVDNSLRTVDNWQNDLWVAEAKQNGLKESTESNGILEKVYQLATFDYHRFPQLIADNLRNDWQPFEQYWLDNLSDR